MNEDKATLRALIKEHAGNLSAIVAVLAMAGEEVTRQGLQYRLERLGLAELAERTRAREGASGPRSPAGDEIVRERLVAAVSATDSLAAAQRKLGVSRRTLFRRLAKHGLNAEKVSRLRAKFLHTGT